MWQRKYRRKAYLALAAAWRENIASGEINMAWRWRQR